MFPILFTKQLWLFKVALRNHNQDFDSPLFDLRGVEWGWGFVFKLISIINTISLVRCSKLWYLHWRFTLSMLVIQRSSKIGLPCPRPRPRPHPTSIPTGWKVFGQSLCLLLRSNTWKKRNSNLNFLSKCFKQLRRSKKNIHHQRGI